MTPKPPPSRDAAFAGLLGALFLLSGATGLIYEVAWFRLLFLKLGGTGLSVATVTAAFMAGLGLGAWLFGTRLGKGMAPVRLYAVLEAFIGLYALLVPALVDLAGQADAFLLGGDAEGAAVRLARFLLAGLVLLPPTICMGGTLPALARLVEEEPHRPGRFVGVLYGLNTTGAVLGAGSAGFLLLPRLGFSTTVWVCAAANLTLAAAAWALSSWRRAGAAAPAPPRREGKGPRRGGPEAAGRPGLAIFAYACSGAIAFMLQVAWARILTLVLASSVYAFSFILVVFLSGLGLGALLAAPLLDQVQSPRRALAWTFTLVGGLSLLGQGLYGKLPALYLEALMHTTGGLALGRAAGLAAAIMLPATLVMGAGFPLAVRLATGDGRPGVAARVGRVYAANTAGSVLGAFTTALILIPLLGLAGVVTLAALAALAVGGGLALAGGKEEDRAGRRALWPLAAGVAVVLLWLAVVPGWNRSLMAESVAFWRKDIQARGEKVWDQLATIAQGEVPRTLFYRDGVTATVAVKEEPPYHGQRSLFMTVDGKVDASSVMDTLQQVLLAQLPLLATDPKGADVLVIGYASGITTGSVLTHPVDSVVVAEIEEVVMEASRLFEFVNRRPLEDPRTEVVINDARAYLERTDRRFDIISSAPSSAWLSGPSKLFTRESFQVIRSRLSPGGILCQYVQAYDLDEDSVLTLLRTIQSVFGHVAVFEAEGVNLLLLASDAPIQFLPSRLARSLTDPEIGADLARAGIRSPCGLLEHLVAEPAAVAAAVGDGPINTDDNALLEYRGPQAVGRVVHREVLARLESSSRGPAAVLAGLGPGGEADAGLLAASCLSEGAVRTAESLARERLSSGPDADALWVLGEGERQQNRRAEALVHFDEAMRLAPGHLPSRTSRALALQELGRQDEALAVWEALAREAGGSPLVLGHLGLARLESGDAEGALVRLRQAREAAGGRRLPLPVDLAIARALERLGREAEARLELEGYLASLRDASAPGLEGAAARQRLADLLERSGLQPDRVAALRAEAEGIRARQAPAILETAIGRFEREGLAAARAYLEQQANLDPGLPAALPGALGRRRASGRPVPEGLQELVAALAAEGDA